MPYFIPFLVLAILSAAFGLSLVFQDQSPIISSLSPRVGNPGEVMVIDGNFFGNDQTRSWVSIAGQRVTSSSVLEWTAHRISLRIPDEVKSGPVVVQSSSGRSKAIAFTSQNQIPRVVQDVPSSIAAEIMAANPASCFPGDLVVLQGHNFGQSERPLSLLVDSRPVLSDEIDSWSNNEIRFWMPTQVQTGSLQLKDDQGLSNSVAVAIQKGPVFVSPGPEQREYRLDLNYEISNVVARSTLHWGSISVYMPMPPQLPGQSADALKNFGAELVAKASGTEVFSITQPLQDTNYRISTQWDIHCAGSRISAGADPAVGYDNYRELQARFASPSPLVPSQEASLKAFVQSAIGTETKPLTVARLLYNAVLNTISLDPDAGLAFAPEVLKDGKAGSFGYANLLTGVLRSAGIPARIIEGVLFLDDAAPRTHYWVEFFIPTIGWVQADPSVGDGLVPAVVPQGVNARDWYFGNSDNRHIALIRGEGATSLTRLDGNIQKLFQRFVLMQVHAESSGDVESYNLSIDTPAVRRVQ